MNALNIYFQLANDYLEEKNFLEAIICYEKSLNTVNNQEEIYQKLSKIFEELNTFYLGKIENTINLAICYDKLGEVFVKGKRWQQAIKAYKNAKQINPKIPLINRKIAECLHKQAQDNQNQIYHKHLQLIKQFPYKLIHYHKALEFEPKNINLYYGLIEALMGQKKFDQAIVIAQTALIIEPQNGTLQEKIAEILTLKESLEYDWKNELKLGDKFFQEKKGKKALKHYRKVIKLKPNNLRIYKHLITNLIALETWQDLINCYQNLLKISPNQSLIYHNLGDTFAKLERWEKAVKNYQMAIKLNANYSWSYHNLAEVYSRLKKWEEAVKNYQMAIKLNPDFVWSYFNLGEAFSQLKQWENALNSYEKALQINPDLPYINKKIAHILQQQGLKFLEKSLKYYEKSIEETPFDWELHHEANKIQQLTSPRENHSPPVSFSTFITPEKYALWWAKNAPKKEDLAKFSEQITTFKYQPLISIIVPIYNTPEKYLTAMIESVLEQIYPHWELCLADDASHQPHIETILQEYAEKDRRIKIIFREENGHISAASNSALSLATGEFIGLLDHDDLLTPDALFQVVKLLNLHPEADFIYSDEDKINEENKLLEPYFKPDWCPDSFLSRMYTCHFGIYRHSLVKEIGGFRLEYEGSQDYDLVLRLTEKTQNIFHIPKILYHWRKHPFSVAGNIEAKPYAYQAAIKALNDALIRRGEKGTIIPHQNFPNIYIVRYQITDYKLVSIIIPFSQEINLLDRCLESIFTHTIYPNFQVIVIDNCSGELDSNFIENWTKKESKRLIFKQLKSKVNQSQLYNLGVNNSEGDYLLFLNSNTEVINYDWLNAMVEQGQRKNIGAVGGILLYSDNTIEHAGIILGIGEIYGHPHRYFASHYPGYCAHLIAINNYSAVSAACLLCRRDIFEEVNGFEEALNVAYYEIDFCLKIKEKKYQIVGLPHVNLYHFDSKNIQIKNNFQYLVKQEQDINYIRKKWNSIINNDPCYNPNLTREREDYTLD